MFWHFPHYNNQGGRPGGAVRDGDWKFIEYYDTGARELYNLATDSGESQNVVARHPDRTADMSRRLHGWIKSMNAQTNSPNPNFKPEMFHKLYEGTDVSHYVPTRADEATRARVLEWRRGMNAALRQAAK